MSTTLQREKRFRIVQEEPGAFRVVGRAIERMVIQTDWENEEAVIYLQHKFARMGVDDALEKAGCRAGDEVRICQRAFDFEGAEDFSEYEELEDAGEDVAVEAIESTASKSSDSRASMARPTTRKAPGSG